ncbi:MAG: DNA polymerase I [bacterium]
MDLLLVDGNAIAYRSHFALSKADLRAPDGSQTAASYGYTATILKLLREYEPRLACVAFDSAEPTFRHKVYDEYKADRPGMPDELASQLSWIKNLTKALGIVVLEVPGYEADDILATIASLAEKKGLKAVIATGDKDMLQVVTPNTRVIMLSGAGRETKEMGVEEVVEKYGVEPDLLPDYFALVGDAVDNIPGVKGIGPKIASQLVRRYGGLEQIYNNFQRIDDERIGRLLESGREKAFQSRSLVSVNRDVPFDLTIDDLRREQPDFENLRGLLRQVGFKKFLAEFGNNQEVDIRYTIWNDKMVWDLDRSVYERLSLYINMEAGSAANAKILGIAICFPDKQAYYFPISHAEPVNLDASSLQKILATFQNHPKVPVITYNSKSLYQVFHRLGVGAPQISSDVMLAAYLADPGGEQPSIETLCRRYLGRSLSIQGEFKGFFPTVAHAAKMCSIRACALFDLVGCLEKELANYDLLRLYQDLEIPLSKVLSRMELRGIKVDRKRLQDLSIEIDKRLQNCEKSAHSMAGHPFNINSPKDVAKVLFEELRLAKGKKTKSGYSTDISVLESLSSEHPLPGIILEYRQMYKTKSAFVDQLLRCADPETDRVHACFNQTTTATGRLSSSNPNLQNIPIRGDLGSQIRMAFIASQPDWVLVSADYSQIELRILAHLSEDPVLIEAFERNQDIHSATAAAIFRISPESVTPQLRSIAKSVNFGLIYGMGARGLAQSTGLRIGEAEVFISQHRRTYPKVYEYIDGSLELARQKGYVETILGRRRYIPLLLSSNHAQRSASERMAINTPIQGSAADIIKVAMVKIDSAMAEMGLKGGMALQVHDEIVIDCPKSELENVISLLKNHMVNVYKLKVPLEVRIGVGYNWYEAHQ